MNELRRIRSGPEPDERAFVVRVQFSADEPDLVIERARDVLGRVIEHVDPWPAEEAWPQLLPPWFVQACAPERSPDPSLDFATRLARWQAKTWDEKVAASQGPWRLSNWLYYFDPIDGEGDDRSWWWWDAASSGPDTGWIDVATTGWPYGTGSLYWLIEASGGVIS
ncbi:hypothetical protein [Streptomyces sp. PKU-EA00015]|uniref:hypothetical protein n=1 Tax=Streptomyces sp. PKU-EA00015 TaxID=2748326 RepID=UPI0028125298|nr:hypothetical protein [Streptomyces sp. PKU-EA00015]